MKEFSRYAPLVVRVALSLVFLWFGISQLSNPDSFLGYVPSWMYPSPSMMQNPMMQMMQAIPKPPAPALIFANGLIETIFGILLFMGLFTRISAAVLAIHLFVIALGLGYNDIMIRDLGLSVVTFSIFLHGPDKWCLDLRRKQNG